MAKTKKIKKGLFADKKTRVALLVIAALLAIGGLVSYFTFAAGYDFTGLTVKDQSSGSSFMVWTYGYLKKSGSPVKSASVTINACNSSKSCGTYNYYANTNNTGFFTKTQIKTYASGCYGYLKYTFSGYSEYKYFDVCPH